MYNNWQLVHQYLVPGTWYLVIIILSCVFWSGAISHVYLHFVDRVQGDDTTTAQQQLCLCVALHRDSQGERRMHLYLPGRGSPLRAWQSSGDAFVRSWLRELIQGIVFRAAEMGVPIVTFESWDS